MIAALFVEKDGCYFNLPEVEPWDLARDARNYPGPHPVVAHPPCGRWGRYWHGSTRKPHQFEKGADAGCFAAALASLRLWGGVLEHPAHSHAWKAFDLPRPAMGAGWLVSSGFAVCHVEQAHYGHAARKATWLLTCRARLPDLIWGPASQRLHPRALELHGYVKARRMGMISMIGGRRKTELRGATPIEFRDLLISIARSVGFEDWVGE